MLANIGLIGGSYLFGALPSIAALARTSGLDVSQERDLHSALWYGELSLTEAWWRTIFHWPTILAKYKEGKA
jgi:hypothetical protein